jgi:hypothetical protein
LGDIATARNFVAARAQTNNLAAPVALDPPVISGTFAPGGTVTCSDGVWTSNAKSFKKTWYTNPKGAKDYEDVEKIGEGDTFILSREDFSKTLLCYVEASGNKRTGGNIAEITLDDLALSASFTSPSDGSSIAGKFTLKATTLASSAGSSSISKICLKLNGKVPTSGYLNGGYSVSFYADNEGCISTSSTSPYWEFDATDWANGTYSFTMVAYDSSGQKSGPVSTNLIVSNADPAATLVSPAEGSVNAGKFTLRGTAAASPGGTATVSKVCLKINGKVPTSGYLNGGYLISFYADNEGCISSSSTSPYWEFDSTAWANGSYLFTYNMYDSSGRISNTAFRTLTISNANPVANLTSPSAGSNISARFTLSGTATPSEFGTASINRVCLKVNDQVPTSGYLNGGYLISFYADSEGCISTSSTAPYWDFDVTNWVGGDYIFSYYAVDSSGRQSNTATRTLRKN